MTTTRKLNQTEIASSLQELKDWRINSQGKLEREYVFHTFREAFSFMIRVAFEAEELNHHPDWSNSYQKVKVELITHEAGGLTEKDIELARRIEKICWI